MLAMLYVGLVLGVLLGVMLGLMLMVLRGGKGVISSDITEEHVSEMRARFESTLYRGIKLWHIQWLIDYVVKEKG